MMVISGLAPLMDIDDYAVPGDVDGEHQLWIWPVDGAGNSAAAADAVPVTMLLDMTPPEPALALTITPSGWQTATTVSYTIAWENPDDLSGIVGACYKLGDEEPVDEGDGVCIGR